MTTPAATNSLTLRLYCHGLGDCNLIGVPDDKGGTFWILIDCGVHTSAPGGSARVKEVVADILKITQRLDVIVGTHEHWDHLSGFLQAKDLFDKFSVGEVWFAWTENPANPDARRIDRFKGAALTALVDTSLALDSHPLMEAEAQGINALLGFVIGLDGERVRDAREHLRALSRNVRHLAPGAIVPLPAAAGAIKVYVLGPPLDPTLFQIQDSASQTYQMSATLGALMNGLAIQADGLSIKNDPLAPFDEGAGLSLSASLAGKEAGFPKDLAFLSRHYAGPVTGPKLPPGVTRSADQGWRRIDSDWLSSGSDLALQLDSSTNNTSLVLAIEVVATGKVLIFAADAQIGNWESWAKVTFPNEGSTTPVTGADLLRRAVFYKVGHHGSRNATLSENGLELMVSPELTAFIPTDEAMAKKVGWSDIPAKKLLARLAEKTAGRVIKSDDNWIQQQSEDLGVKIGGSLQSITVQHGGPGPFEGAPYVEIMIG
ncbi:MBL fold metallo-hydrolase [Mesorhizobium sp. ES1-3]|uniref:MBL fold metallo-hydrolase n=1 Tax=Mesorhizobium sp. ES1-3 TaxID=2876628 RepID=UPI001CCD23CD|nr:MBL fold metallo-hydrolase [Mesorhizobium sp. ES1-3]MBZ9673980.1 MBL fold metallo-hydrolase [Mesorhizobium sp. ES1-3]